MTKIVLREEIPAPAPQVILTPQEMIRLFKITYPITCNDGISKCQECKTTKKCKR